MVREAERPSDVDSRARINLVDLSFSGTVGARLISEIELLCLLWIIKRFLSFVGVETLSLAKLYLVNQFDVYKHPDRAMIKRADISPELEGFRSIESEMGPNISNKSTRGAN